MCVCVREKGPLSNLKKKETHTRTERERERERDVEKHEKGEERDQYRGRRGK